MAGPGKRPSCPPTTRKSVGGCDTNTPGKDAKNTTKVGKPGAIKGCS